MIKHITCIVYRLDRNVVGVLLGFSNFNAMPTWPWIVNGSSCPTFFLEIWDWMPLKCLYSCKCISIKLTYLKFVPTYARFNRYLFILHYLIFIMNKFTNLESSKCTRLLIFCYFWLEFLLFILKYRLTMRWIMRLSLFISQQIAVENVVTWHVNAVLFILSSSLKHLIHRLDGRFAEWVRMGELYSSF